MRGVHDENIRVPGRSRLVIFQLSPVSSPVAQRRSGFLCPLLDVGGFYWPVSTRQQ